MKYFFSTLLFFLIIINLPAQYTTIANGNYNNSAIWNLGSVPPNFGNHSVIINHDVILNRNLNGGNWSLTINVGASLIQTGCRNIQSYGAGFEMINNGSVTCRLINTPGGLTNNSTMNVGRLEFYNAASFLNNLGAVFNTTRLVFSGSSAFENYGTYNSQATVACINSLPNLNFNFTGNTLYNNGTININGIGVHGISSFINDSTGIINSNINLDITQTTTFDNYGEINLGRDLLITNTNTNNYNIINVGRHMQNNNNSTLNNYGCDCYGAYNGTINITNDITNNSGTIDNNGIINVNGGDVSNNGDLGSSSCGLLDLTSSGEIQSSNGSTLFGNLVIIGSSSCYSCSSDASVYVTNDEDSDCDAALTLPITLVSFKAKLNENIVNLSWITSTEINNEKFFIERSIDGEKFETIGTLSGAGNSNTILNYSFKDNYPLTGNSYYRLKQVDFNRNFSYSKLQNIYLSPTKIIRIFPTPAITNVNVLISSVVEQVITFSVYNDKGQTVINLNKEINAGLNTITLNTSNLKAGFYTFNVNSNNTSLLSKRIIIAN